MQDSSIKSTEAYDASVVLSSKRSESQAKNRSAVRANKLETTYQRNGDGGSSAVIGSKKRAAHIDNNGVRNGTGHKTAEILQQFAIDANADIGNSGPLTSSIYINHPGVYGKTFREEQSLTAGLGVRNAYGLQHNSQEQKKQQKHRKVVNNFTNEYSAIDMEIESLRKT